jgi:hypothetical protein
VRRDTGAALIIALLAMLLLSALGLMLVLNTSLEIMIAGNFRSGQEALYAADAGAERVMADLMNAADWNNILRGAERSVFVDGSQPGARTLSDGSTIDLVKATNLLNCGRPAACSPPEMDALTADRPWGANNPRWILYAYGPLSAMVSTGTIDSTMYVAVWVSDDESENDNDPTTDGDSQSNPGSGITMLHVEAFGPGGTRKAVDVKVRRVDGSQPPRGIQLMSWREAR